MPRHSPEVHGLDKPAPAGRPLAAIGVWPSRSYEGVNEPHEWHAIVDYGGLNRRAASCNRMKRFETA